MGISTPDEQAAWLVPGNIWIVTHRPRFAAGRNTCEAFFACAYTIKPFWIPKMSCSCLRLVKKEWRAEYALMPL